MKQRIGMAGIGMMGLGIATNLLKHGHTLTFLEHPGNQPVDALKAAGAAGAPTPAAMAARSDIVILVLTGAPAVESVVLGEAGVLEGLAPGGVVIDCSTSLPETTARVAAAVRARGGRMLDAPMTRTPKEAMEGKLNLLVGGDPDLLEACRPLLSTFAENILHAGASGAGHSMKLLHNFVSLGMISLLAEAAACSQQLGISPGVFVEILAKGGGRSVALDRISPYLLSGDSSPLRFSVANAAKDTQYYTHMASQAGTDRTIADAVHASLARAAQDAPQALMPELARIVGERK